MVTFRTNNANSNQSCSRELYLYGCTVGDISALGDPALLTATASVLSDAGCEGQANGAANVSTSGGTGALTYLWSSGGTSSIENSLTAGTYTIIVTDVNGCSASDLATINETTSTDLYGEITATTLNISNGLVFAFKSQPSTNGIDTVAITSIIAGTPNRYNFSGLLANDYLIKVVPNTVTYPTAVPTYYGKEFQWDSSIVVTHGCAQNDTADIEVIEIIPATGTGFISGYVLEGPGFGTARFGPGVTPNVPFAPGGPLKGVDVKLGKNPGGGIQARVMTDSTGYYSFDSLPLEGYKIYVDIPNLPMDSTRAVDLGNGDTISVQNNYFADSVYIYIVK